ncbi:glycosyltransferase [Methylobacter sp.]|uniref:glycosyltransferase n=1 Tax=Methylobacter sp. TaxID=2051955 RepID=UPI00121A04D1|nr:glycosyltransferase [Methylobacter sp.]TAK64219.1 MAG: glycosyltransferase [Methylobacter sp.]
MNSLPQLVSHRNWVLHDYMQVNGGAERLVSTIVRGIPDFSLGVSGVYPGFLESADLSGINLKLLGQLPKWLPRIPKALLTFGRRIPCIENIDTVIYSGIYTPLAVKSQKAGRRIYYCHTPPRFAFDRKNQYLEKLPISARRLVSVAIDAYCQAYKSAVDEMDVILTNSDHVRKRLGEQLGVDAYVVCPPVDINAFKWQAQGDYYLSLGRLEPNKRVDRVVKAFIKMPEKKLIVASGGSEFETLRNLAMEAPNITFVGWSSDKQLIDLIANAIACIYIPLDEDFGMSAIEAMAAGKPVIGVAEGGMLETVLDGHTGILLPSNPDIEQIAAAVLDMTAHLALSMRECCEQRAMDFTEERFLEQISSFVSG